MRRKMCSKCNRCLSIGSFARNICTKDGRAHYCKECFNEINWNYLNKNRRKHKRNVLLFRKALAQFVRWLRSYLPCANCKRFVIPEALQFDHITLARHMQNGGKSKIANSTFHHFLIEIVKTRPLCANCHAIRTAQQRACKWKD